MSYEGLKAWDLKDEVVYGPFQTRRQGNTLGINLLPPGRKHCTFNCVYCQCGWTKEEVPLRSEDFVDYPSPAAVRGRIEARFSELRDEGVVPDAILVSGNGEPTLHPRLGEAVDALLELRERFFPWARTAVLTAGTQLGDAEVRRAVDRLDDRIVKLDAGTDERQRQVAMPRVDFTLDRLEEWVGQLRDVVLQSCFVRGRVDNTSVADVEAWIGRAGRIAPKYVQVYSLDRAPAATGLARVDRTSLEQFARRLRERTGIEVRVY